MTSLPLEPTNKLGSKVCTFIHSINHSFRPFLQHLFKSTTTQKCSRHSTDTVPEFHAEAPHATAKEELAQGPYLGGKNKTRTHDPSVKRYRLYKCTTKPHNIGCTLVVHCCWKIRWLVRGLISGHLLSQAKVKKVKSLTVTQGASPSVNLMAYKGR